MRQMALQESKGFTLIEVMLALGILAFGILAVASMQISSLSGTDSAHRMTEGTTFAQDQIERFIALPYDHVDLQSGVSHMVTQGNYFITWSVTDNVPVVNTKTVDVDVSWTEKGANKSTSLVYIKMDVI